MADKIGYKIKDDDIAMKFLYSLLHFMPSLLANFNTFVSFLQKALCFFMLTMTVAWHRDLIQTGKVRFQMFLRADEMDNIVYWRQK